MFCRSLFVLLSFFFRPLCCLPFFGLQILITSLISSHSSYTGLTWRPLISLNIYDCFILNLLEVLNYDLFGPKITTCTNIHWPRYCTVHVYVFIIFVTVCGVFEWERICAGFQLFDYICIVIGDHINVLPRHMFVPVSNQEFQRHLSWTFCVQWFDVRGGQCLYVLLILAELFIITV
jgi:hypothetical protein